MQPPSSGATSNGIHPLLRCHADGNHPLLQHHADGNHPLLQHHAAGIHLPLLHLSHGMDLATTGNSHPSTPARRSTSASSIYPSSFDLPTVGGSLDFFFQDEGDAVASQVLMCAGYVVMAFGMPGSLFVGSVVVGICYGVRLAVTVPTASELFGLKYYGLIYNILILNLPLGSFLFSGLLTGLLYDAEATKVPGGGNTCSNVHCYHLVFMVMAAVSFGLDVLLSLRTRRVYAKIHQANRAKRSAAASHAQRVS